MTIIIIIISKMHAQVNLLHNNIMIFYIKFHSNNTTNNYNIFNNAQH